MCVLTYLRFYGKLHIGKKHNFDLQTNKTKMSKFVLSVCAIFKNEAHVLNEWISHHLKEGVDHFYLIDNGSSDEYQPILEKYTDVVTLFVDDAKHSQERLYNKYVLPLKEDSELMMIIDLDEFVYSRKEFSTIPAFLSSLPENFSSISMPMKLFGSSGHIVQPPTVVPHFLYRMDTFDEHLGWWKQIVRANVLSKIRTHDHDVSSGLKLRSDLTPFHNTLLSQPMDEETTCAFFQNAFVHINHYKIQSFNWFKEIKCTRGAANCKQEENLRNEEYFRQNDCNQQLDNELFLKYQLYADDSL